MENSEVQSTPMGRVWAIVLTSMCIVLGVSWIWHVNGMNEQLRRDKAVDDLVIKNTEQIARYRDVLKEKGKAGAAAYLATSSPNTYGNQ